MKRLKLALLGVTFGALFSTNYLYAATCTITPSEISTLATVAAIDENEILVSTVASDKTNNTHVANFAKMMIVQHSNNLAQILGMPKNSSALSLALSTGTAQKFLQQGNEGLTTLGALQGSRFDHAYVDAMVTGHEAALQLIDTQLMQTATSKKMKAFLTATRAVVVQHLDHAKALQKQLNS